MSREALAAQQASLLRALLAGGPAPAGFDPDRLRVEAEVLRRKHGRLIAFLRPDLAEALGDRFGGLFAEFTAAHPKSDTTRAHAYAEVFATWLVAHGDLPKPKRRLGSLLHRR